MSETIFDAQPPVADRHLRFVPRDGWGVSLCGAADGVLFAEPDAVNCQACIGHHQAGTRNISPVEAHYGAPGEYAEVDGE